MHVTSTRAVVFALVLGFAATPAAWAGEHAGCIVLGKPALERIERGGAADMGRIYGDLKACPGCTVRVLGPEGKLVQATTVHEGALVYELRSLPAGTYQLQAEAEGYQTVTRVEVAVQGKHDTRLDIRFGKGDGGETEDPPEWEPPKGRDDDKPPRNPGSAKKGDKEQDKNRGKRPGKKKNPNKGKKKGDPKKGEKKQ